MEVNNEDSAPSSDTFTIENLLKLNAQLNEENALLKQRISKLEEEIKHLRFEKLSEEPKVTRTLSKTKSLNDTTSILSLIPIETEEQKNGTNTTTEGLDLAISSQTVENNDNTYNLKEQNPTKRIRTMIRSDNNDMDKISQLRSMSFDRNKSPPTPSQQQQQQSPAMNIASFSNSLSKSTKKEVFKLLKLTINTNEESNTKDSLNLLKYTPLNTEQPHLTESEYTDFIKKNFERPPNDALPRGLQGSLQRDTGSIYTWGEFYNVIQDDVNTKCQKIAKTMDKSKLFQDSPAVAVKLDEDIGDSASLVACGANSTLIVSDHGIIIKSSSNIGGSVCIGIPNSPPTKSNYFSINTKYILGRRLVKVACGPFHFAAISDANEVILWGENRIMASKSNNSVKITGQLGFSNNAVSAPRFAVGISGTVIDIACGMYHTVAASSFAVYSCGSNEFGQLGRDGNEEEFQIVPGLFNDDGVPYSITSVACGLYHSVAQTKCGTLFMWGKNQGHIEERDHNYISTIPKEVSNFRGAVKSVACGYYHTLVLTTNGVFSCGATTFGQLGRGQQKKDFGYFEKVVIPGSKSIESVSCGPFSSFALKKNGEVYTWGFLCSPSKSKHQYSPRLMEELSEKNLCIRSVAAGATHCCFLVDKRTTTSYENFLKACLFSGRISNQIIFKSLPRDTSIIKYIQERAVKKIQSLSPNSPSISIDKAYIYHTFTSSSVGTTTQYITIKNTCIHELEVIGYIPEGQNQATEGVAIGVHPTGVFLSPGETSTLRINIRHNQEHESRFFLCFMVSLSRGNKVSMAKEGIKYYVLVHLVPFFGSLDTYRKLEEKKNDVFLAQLASHVPQEILFRLCSSGLPTQPTVQILKAAVLILDISGFTTLTHHLSQAGQSGGETITEYLNSYFSMLITVVNKHGGDIAKFVGDALICLFTNEPHWTDNPDSMDQLLLRAVQCAMEVQRDCAEYSREGLKLTLHIAVGAGELSSMIVGGTNKVWHYFVSGSAISNLNTALESSSTGEVVVSGNSWHLIEKFCDAEKRGNDWKINSVHNEPVLRSLVQPPVPDEAELAFRSIIPYFVQNAYERGARVDELRKATVMFIKLSNINYTDNVQSNCLTINNLVLIMQQEIFRQEGMIIQFFEDEKGTLLLASFGLPPLSHEDDAIRAVRSALAVHHALQRVDVKSAIGVTTGDLFCGLVGSNTRKEYTIISSSVNLASRLMGVIAKLGGGVLCDQATRDACYPRLQFEALAPVVVKGTVDAVPIFKPLENVVEEQRRRNSSFPTYTSTIVGRKKLLHKIKTHLHELVRGNTTWVTVITGPEGIGKSTLAFFAVQLANTWGVYTLFGISDPLQRATPFYVWKNIILQLLDLTQFKISSLPSEELIRDLSAKFECEEHFLPLLNNILSIDLPSNPICDKLSNSAKNSFLLGIFKGLIERKSTSKPLLIVIENLHWIDCLSLSLASFVAKLRTPILLLVTVRPIQETEVTKYSQFFSSPNIRHITIPPLSHKHCVKLAISLFKAQESIKVPNQINSIITKSQGNPYFCLELLLGFRDSGLISVNQFGNWVISPDLNITEIPSSVESAINSRIDCLAASTQDVLKIASVIGQEFEMSILQILCCEDELEAKLKLLVKLDFLRASRSKYTFISESVYKIAYSRLLFAQRKDLHERLALFYEEKYSGKPQYIPILAYHWDQVISASTSPSMNAISKAINYMKLSGEIASRQEDKGEAAFWFARSLELLQKNVSEKGRSNLEDEKPGMGNKLKLQVMGMALKEVNSFANDLRTSL